MGLLRVKGTIDLAQFWPTGESPNILSDADTVHVQVDPKSSFVFEGKTTRAFDYAWISTRKNKNGTRSPNYVIVSQDKPNAHIKIRLQGIDAPELHYNVDKKKPEVRQNWGKRSTFELSKHLKKFANGTTLDCHVDTLVNSPNDAFDMYGRLVGDIMVNGKSINHWLVANGWAFPTFYNSMLLSEINAIRTLWAKTKGGATGAITDRTSDDMYGLPAGKKGDNPSQAAADKGKVSLPKMFRRLVGYRENSKGATSLDAFLELPSKKSDLVIELGVFKKLTAEQRANPKKKAPNALVKFHTLVSSPNKLRKKPENLVFVEEPAALKNSTGKVTSWSEQGKPVKIV